MARNSKIANNKLTSTVSFDEQNDKTQEIMITKASCPYKTVFPPYHPAIPILTSVKRQRFLCYNVSKVEKKSQLKCKKCQKHFCLNKERNCMVVRHYGPIKDLFL